MTNPLQQIIQLCQEENGKVFILDHQGNLQLVVMAATQYQSLKSGGQQRLSDDVVDVDAVNKQITQAQLIDDVNRPSATEGTPLQAGDGPVSIKSVLQKWHKQPKRPVFQQQDLREEVIDLSWNDDSANELSS